MSEPAIKFVETNENPAPARKQKDPDRNLVERDGWWYVVIEYRGTRYKRSTGLPAGTAIGTVRAWRDQFLAALREGRFEDIQASKLRKAVSVPTIGEICEAYLEQSRTLGRPTQGTARMNCAALKRIVAEGTGKDADGQPTTILDRALVQRWVGMRVAGAGAQEASARRTLHSYMRQAKSLFARRYEYPGLPDIGPFVRADVGFKPGVIAAPWTPREIEVLRSGSELRDGDRNLYAAWFAGYYLGLRIGETAQVRRSWLEEYTPARLAEMRQAGLLGQTAPAIDAAGIWVLHVQPDLESGARLKSEFSAGYVPLAADVHAELVRIMGDREYLIDGPTWGERRDRIMRGLGAWFRAAGWSRRKTSHALRAWRTEIWARNVGEGTADNWARHAPARLIQRHYVSRLDLSRSPLGLCC
jgi:hypothetical protein